MLQQKFPAMTLSKMSYGDSADMRVGRTRLFLVRHGELITSLEWRYVGHMDVDLNDTGIRQMQHLARCLRHQGVEAILSSDLKRTVASAAIIGETLGLDPVAYRDFREINLGCWEGLTRDEIVRRFPEDFAQRAADMTRFRIEGGESFDDVRKRVLPRLQESLAQHRGKNILLVAHGGVNRVILSHVMGLPPNNLFCIDQAYGCLNIIDYFGDEPVVRLLNGIVGEGQ